MVAGQGGAQVDALDEKGHEGAPLLAGGGPVPAEDFQHLAPGPSVDRHRIQGPVHGLGRHGAHHLPHHRAFHLYHPGMQVPQFNLHQFVGEPTEDRQQHQEHQQFGFHPGLLRGHRMPVRRVQVWYFSVVAK